MKRILASGVGLTTTVLLVGACGGAREPAPNYTRAAANVTTTPTGMESPPYPTGTQSPTSTGSPTGSPTGTMTGTASPTGTGTMMPVPEHAKVKVAQSSQYGKILVGENDRALYMFEKDKDNTSNCYDNCAVTWPPLLTRGKPEAGTGVKQDLLGTATRRNGDKQVTYNKMPLYYYTGDRNAGEYTGQGKNEFGGKWYLVSPDGKKVEK
ncbi:COG4315 family predicted lipoprotein [Sphaerisporangium fuscum]|uniref:COG4315 family predicted lipoprotein n=1 Tax=Sphaerisporangium fuscum TaxID=2835868 RepID=UPI001BDD9F1C|nr:hypothetical protein [Sphaerisporangium fuscum]